MITVCVTPDPSRLHVERPVLGVAEDRARRARPGLLGAKLSDGRLESRARAARRCRAVGSNAIGCAGRLGRVSADLDGRVLLARDHVRVRHHHVRRRPPTPSPRSRARRRCRPPARRCARPPAPRARAAIAGSGAATSGEGPLIDGHRIQPRERVQDRPGRGQHLVELAQDHRALDVRAAAGPAPASGLRRRRRSTRSPGPAPRRAPRPAARRAAPMPGMIRMRRSLKPTPSRPLARIAPPSSAPSRPNAGAYGEAEPCESTSGPSRVPRNAPSANPQNESTPTMKPCRKPEDREDRRERDYEPVQLCHLPCSTSSLTENRNQRLRRARPVLALAAVAFAPARSSARSTRASPAYALADQFVTAWTQRRLRDACTPTSPPPPSVPSR